MIQLKTDPEFKSLIPPLTDEEYQQLTGNLIKEGCRDALITWNGTIIDGHNRYEICNYHKIEFRTEERNFQNRDEAKEWIIRNQFGRRNLTPFQRAELALQLKPLIQAKAKENQQVFKGNQYTGGNYQNSDKNQKIDTYKEVAKIAKVSHMSFRGKTLTITRARRVTFNPNDNTIDIGKFLLRARRVGCVTD